MARDAAVEKWLTDNGYSWRFVKDHPLAEIDIQEATNNPSRLQRGLDNNLAYQYAEDMDGGADFPAIVLQEIVKQPLKKVWGGVHRIHGATTALRTCLDAIVVREADPYRIDLATRVLNSLGVGRGENENGKLHQIAELQRLHGSAAKIPALAKHFRVHRDTVTKYLKVTTADRRADRLGIGTFFPKMSQELRVELDKLQSDNVLIAATHLIQTHQNELRGGAGISLAKELRELGYETTAVAMIADRDKELTALADERKAKKDRTPTGMATAYLGRVHGLVRFYPGTAEKLYFAGLGTWQTIRREAKQVYRAIDILHDIVADMERIADEKEKAAEWTQAHRPGASPSDPT
jgi:hypothetical protein